MKRLVETPALCHVLGNLECPHGMNLKDQENDQSKVLEKIPSFLILWLSRVDVFEGM